MHVVRTENRFRPQHELTLYLIHSDCHKLDFYQHRASFQLAAAGSNAVSRATCKQGVWSEVERWGATASCIYILYHEYCVTSCLSDCAQTDVIEPPAHSYVLLIILEGK